MEDENRLKNFKAGSRLNFHTAIAKDSCGATFTAFYGVVKQINKDGFIATLHHHLSKKEFDYFFPIKGMGLGECDNGTWVVCYRQGEMIPEFVLAVK